MSDEIEDSDDIRPARFVHDESIRAYDGSSISSVKQFFKGNKELLLMIVLLAAVAALGYVFSEMKFYERKYEAAASSLADEDRLQRNHSDQLKEEIRAAELAITIARCKQ